MYDANNPGFKNIILQPELDPNKNITWVDCSHDSPYGKIISNWEYKDGNYTYETVVPANTTASVYLPVIYEEL